MPFKRRFKDKYAGSSRERICCPNSVRLVLFLFPPNKGDPNFLTEDLWSHFVADHGAASDGQQARGTFFHRSFSPGPPWFHTVMMTGPHDELDH